MSGRKTWRMGTTTAIDKLVTQFHKPKQNQLAIAQSIVEKCDQYIKEHTEITSRTDAILQLKRRAEVFISLHSIPSVDDWINSIKVIKAPDQQVQDLINEITQLVDQFYYPDADQKKAAIKIIKKCNQYLDEQGDDALYADDAGGLLARAIYFLDMQQAMNPTPIDHNEFVQNLGLAR